MLERLTQSPRWRRLLPAVLLMSATVSFLVTLLAWWQFEHVLIEHHRYHKQVREQQLLLSSVKKHLGYGGLIDQFRRYLLHAETEALAAVADQAEALRETLATYASVTEDAQVHAALDQLGHTLAEYEASIPLLLELRRTGLPVEVIDARLGLDDAPARAALARLDQHLADLSTDGLLGFPREASQRLIATLIGMLAVLIVLGAVLFSAFGVLWRVLQREQLTTQRWQGQRDLNQAILDATADVVITIDQHGIIRQINRRCEALLGYTAEELIGTSVNRLMSHSEAAQHDGYIARYLNTGVSQAVDQCRTMPVRHRDGHLFPAELSIRRLERDGQVLFTGLLHDIRERERYERQIRARTTLFEGIFQNSPDALLLVDEQCRLHLANPAFFTLFGYRPDEVINAPVMHFHLHPQFDAEGGCLHGCLLKQTSTPARTIEYRTRDGRSFPGEMLSTCLPAIDIDGQPGALIIIRDLSERQRLNATLAEREAEAQRADQHLRMFKTTLDLAHDCVFIFDADTLRFTYVNQGAIEQIGYEDSELLGMCPFEIKPDFDELLFRALLGPLKAGSLSELRFETRHRHRDGHDVPVEIYLQYLAPAGESPRYVAIVRDITERKAHELALERQLRNLTTMSAISALAERDPDARARAALELARAHLELDVGLICRAEAGYYHIEHYRGPDLPGVDTGQRFALNGTYCELTMKSADVIAIDQVRDEIERLHPAHQLFPVASYLGAPVWVNGELYGTVSFTACASNARSFERGDQEFMRLFARWVGATLDIQQASEALRHSEERLQRSQSFANIGTWEWVIQTGEIYWSERIAPLFGYTEPINHARYEQFLAALHPEDRERVGAAIRNCIEHGADYDIEHRVIWQDGQVRWLHERGNVVRAEDGTALKMFGVVQDISERHRIQSELDRFHQVIDAAEQAIGIATLKGELIYVNQTHCQLLGYQHPEQLIGRNWHELIPEQAQAQAMELNAHLHQGCSWHAHLPLQRQDGSVFISRANAGVVRDQQGQLIFVFNIFEDDTEDLQRKYDLIAAKNAAEQARQEIEHFQRILEATDQGVGMASMEGELIYVNPAHCRICGYSDREQLLGRNWSELIAENQSEIMAQFNERLTRGENIHGQLSIRRADGESCVIRINAGVIKDTRGAPQLMFMIFEDYTEELARRHELMRAKDSAEQANQAKSIFLSRMSHELRTPLNSVLGFAQVLASSRREPLSERQAEQVRYIEHSGRHLLDLLNEILDLARIESGRLSLALESVALDEVLQECLELMTTQARERAIELQYEPAQQPILLWADRLRMKQVVLNLLSNAVKYNREDGHVFVSHHALDASWQRMMIRDTGPGIAAEHLDAIFEPFNRLDADRSEIEGTGIGLTLTHELVEHMGGRLGVESTLGEGTTFWVDWPLYKRH